MFWFHMMLLMVIIICDDSADGREQKGLGWLVGWLVEKYLDDSAESATHQDCSF